MVKLVVQKRKARMGRNPATGEPIKIPAKTVVKARIVKQLKDAVLPARSRRPRVRDGVSSSPSRARRSTSLIFLASSRISSRSILNFSVDSGTPR